MTIPIIRALYSPSKNSTQRHYGLNNKEIILR